MEDKIEPDVWIVHKARTSLYTQKYYQHTCCAALVTVAYPYCPHCGHPMVENKEEDDGER